MRGGEGTGVLGEPSGDIVNSSRYKQQSLLVLRFAALPDRGCCARFRSHLFCQIPVTISSDHLTPPNVSLSDTALKLTKLSLA